jgi:hypothetical protein
MEHHQKFEDLDWSVAKTLRVFAIETFTSHTPKLGRCNSRRCENRPLPRSGRFWTRPRSCGEQPSRSEEAQS